MSHSFTVEIQTTVSCDIVAGMLHDVLEPNEPPAWFATLLRVDPPAGTVLSDYKIGGRLRPAELTKSPVGVAAVIATLDGGSVKVAVDELDTAEPNKREVVIDRGQILKALSKLAAEQPDDWTVILDDNADEEIAWRLLQYIVYGRVAF